MSGPIEFKDEAVFFKGEKLYKRKKGGGVNKCEKDAYIKESDNIYKWLTVLCNHPDTKLTCVQIFNEIDKDKRWSGKKDNSRWKAKKEQPWPFKDEYKDFKNSLIDIGYLDESNQIIRKERSNEWTCITIAENDRYKDGRRKKAYEEVFEYKTKIINEPAIDHQLKDIIFDDKWPSLVKNIYNKVINHQPKNIIFDDKWPSLVKNILTNDKWDDFHVILDDEFELSLNPYLHGHGLDSDGWWSLVDLYHLPRDPLNEIESNLFCIQYDFGLISGIATEKLLEFCAPHAEVNNLCNKVYFQNRNSVDIRLELRFLLDGDNAISTELFLIYVSRFWKELIAANDTLMKNDWLRD